MTIYCPICAMTLHRRYHFRDLTLVFLLCPTEHQGAHVWCVPIEDLENIQSLKPFEVKDTETINRALDGIRL